MPIKERSPAELFRLAQKGPPWSLFHGTLALRMPTILKDGLLTSTPERRNFENFATSTQGNISFVEDSDTAEKFAVFAATEYGRKEGKLPDTAVLLIDTKIARLTQGVVFWPLNTLNEYKAQEWITEEPVRPSAFVGYWTYTHGHGVAGRKEEYHKL